MTRRVVILHEEFGVYLGNCMGLGFFSLLDSVGQWQATTFTDSDDALRFIQSWEVQPTDMHRISYPVVVTNGGEYATVADLKGAGLKNFLGDMEENMLREARAMGVA